MVEGWDVVVNNIHCCARDVFDNEVFCDHPNHPDRIDTPNITILGVKCNREKCPIKVETFC